MVAATFNRQMDAASMTGYWIGLQDLELYAVQRACQRAIRECEYMPTVKNIRDFAGLYHQSKPTPLELEEGAGEPSIGMSARLRDILRHNGLVALLLAIVVCSTTDGQFVRRWRDLYHAEVLQEYERTQLQRWNWETQAVGRGGVQIAPHAVGGGWIGRRNARVASAVQLRYAQPEAVKSSMDLRLARRKVRRRRITYVAEIAQAAGAIVGAATP